MNTSRIALHVRRGLPAALAALVFGGASMAVPITTSAAAPVASGPTAGLGGCPSIEVLDARQKALRAATDTAAEPAPAKPALRTELIAMRDRDQNARLAASTSARANGGRPDQPLIVAIFDADQENLAHFHEIVDSDGFPDAAAVGRDGVNAAFLLAQHADSDREFQAHVLELMAPLAAKGDVAAQDFAQLTDRVRIGAGQPQLYGSQFRAVGGINHPQPIEDAANVDARRAQAGLLPLRDYGCIMQQAYGFPVDLTPNSQIVVR
ncbi:MAG: hypothetical protein NVS9B10_26240 [Nevskia sp.]